MATNKTTTGTPAGGFDPKPTHLTASEYQQLETEKKDFTQKQLDANCEFMWQHYQRILREIDKSLERGIKAQFVAGRKDRMTQAKEKRDAAKVASKKASQD